MRLVNSFGLCLGLLVASSSSPAAHWPQHRAEAARMQFDWAYHALMSEGLLYFGSSAGFELYALDAVTGE